MNKVHKMRKGTIAALLSINYSSVQSIIGAFETSGRTNKKQYLLMAYMQNKGLQSQRESSTRKRGRKMLDIDTAVLFDAFGDLDPAAASKSSKLRLYVDQKSDKLKLFTEKEKYPYDLGFQTKELDIIFNDITKGDEDGNNSRDLFNKDLANFNMEYAADYDPSDKVAVKNSRTLPVVCSAENEEKTLEHPEKDEN
jgi:hypothetical protein